jgi:hypothetical protein
MLALFTILISYPLVNKINKLVHLHNGHHSEIDRKQNIDTHNAWMDLNALYQPKNLPQKASCLLNDSICMPFQKVHNRKLISGFQELAMGTRVVQKGPEESLGSMELFYSVS